VAKSRLHRRRRRGGPQLVAVGDARYWQLVRQLPRGVTLSAPARARLRMLDWHIRHRRCVAYTADHFGYSRPTVYRWLARYEATNLASLEDRSSRPRRCRRPAWTVAQIEAVRELREQYPAWSRVKLAVVLRRQGISLSGSTVGRIIAYLHRRGALRQPLRARISVRHRGYARPHAVRKPKGLAVSQPGDLVQLDTLDVRPPGLTKPFKQFTARDVVSRWDVLTLAPNARATSAVTILDALALRMPFAVRAISVDNGSEFMADFEAECARRGIALYTLPPRSPKLNGAVERANRTHTEEFYELTDAPAELEPLRAALADWEVCYNTFRPHQALGYLTPAEWLSQAGYLPRQV
jgi:putative transposase